MIRVLIAEDQSMVRGALRALLELEGDIEVVAEVGRGDEVVPAARDHKLGPGEFASHTVRTVAGSRVAGALGADATVHCYHHQAVDRLPAGLRASAHAEDGVVEGVELDGDGFAVGVQWHPEQTLDDLRLMESLVQAAREHLAATSKEKV